jgi:hypothetical protein
MTRDNLVGIYWRVTALGVLGLLGATVVITVY